MNIMYIVVEFVKCLFLLICIVTGGMYLLISNFCFWLEYECAFLCYVVLYGF